MTERTEEISNGWIIYMIIGLFISDTIRFEISSNFYKRRSSTIEGASNSGRRYFYPFIINL